MKTLLGNPFSALALGFTLFWFASGCAGTSVERSTGESLDDAAITTTLHTLLYADPIVQTSEVGVETNNGVVHLSGFVSTVEQRVRAEQLARSVPGVADVRNQLTVTSDAAPQD